MVVSLTQMVPACLAIGVAAGVVMHRSDYCLTAGLIPGTWLGGRLLVNLLK